MRASERLSPKIVSVVVNVTKSTYVYQLHAYPHLSLPLTIFSLSLSLYPLTYHRLFFSNIVLHALADDTRNAT